MFVYFMKRLIFVLVFLILVSGVFAMDDSIKVRSVKGYDVKIFVWPNDYGPAINSAVGVVDEDGFFETTFFSLGEGDYWLQISVFDLDGDKVRDFELRDMKIDKPIFIDCISECFVFFGDIVEDVESTDNESEDVVLDELAVNISLEHEDLQTGNEVTIVTEDVEVIEEKEENVLVYLTGKVMSIGENFGSWKYSGVGGIVIFLFVIVGIFMMARRGKKEEENIVSEDDKELKYMEKKMKETEAKIGEIKDEKAKKVRLETTRVKLREEEKELRELEGKKDEKKDEENAKG